MSADPRKTALSPSVILALDQARCSASGLLHGDASGLRALAHPCPGGLRLSAFEDGVLILALTARLESAPSFFPERDLSELSGSLWEAIAASTALADHERKARAWDTWLEIFEGLPLLAQKNPAPKLPKPSARC